MYVCLPACQPASLTGCQSVSLPVCQSVCMPVCLPASMSVCLPAFQSASQPACLPASLHACLPACMPACMPARPSVCRCSQTAGRNSCSNISGDISTVRVDCHSFLSSIHTSVRPRSFLQVRNTPKRPNSDNLDGDNCGHSGDRE